MPSDNPATTQEVARLLDCVPAVLSYWDSTQRCRFCNQASTRWWGLPPESVVGKHASELLGPLYRLNLPHIERVLQGEPQQFEREIPDPHGGPGRCSQISYTPEIVDGRVPGFFVLVTDVSDAKRAQFALRASEAHLQQILDTAATGLTRCSRDLRYISANRAFADIAGLLVEQIVGRPMVEVIGREALQTLRPYIDRVLRGETVEFESEVPFRLGGQRHLQVVYTPWKEPDGSVSGWVASITDVSDRKRAEIAYRTSDERYRLLLDATTVGTWDEDLQTGRAIWNAQAFRILGRTVQSEPVTAQDWSTCVHPDDRARVSEAYQRARADGSLYECEHRIVRPDGSVRWIAPYGRFLLDSSGCAQRFVGVFRDVTEHKQSLEAQARLAAIVDSSSDAILSETLDGIITSWNPGAKRLFGYTAEEIVGQSVRTLLSADRQQEKQEMLLRAARGEATDSMETTRLRNDGTTVSVSITMSPVEDAQHRIVGASTIARDITDRERAQAALRASEERQRALIGAIPQMVWTCDSQGLCEFVNSQWLEYSGLSLQQCLEYGWSAAVHERDRERLLALWREALARSSILDTDARLRAADGSYRWFKVRAMPILDTHGRATQWFGTSTDITDLVNAREAEQRVAEQLRESDRRKDELLARIRELAESLATVREDERHAVAIRLHEGVAQDLYAAQLRLRELERKGRGDSGITEVVAELSRLMDESIEHVRNLTDQLYPTSLVHLSLSKALQQLGRQFAKRSGVRVIVDELPDFPELNAEGRVLFFRAAQEALANVARHAQASAVNVTLEADTGRIAMLVADDGKGIAADDLHKAGSLGLLGIRERFAAAGGGLAIERGGSSGTRLTVFLPSGKSNFVTAERAKRSAALTATKGRRTPSEEARMREDSVAPRSR